MDALPPFPHCIGPGEPGHLPRNQAAYQIREFVFVGVAITHQHPDSAGIADDDRANLDQLQPQVVGAHPLEQGVSEAGQDQPPLIGPPLNARRSIRKQIQLLILDPVFHIASGAVLFVIELKTVVIAGADDKARIGAKLAFFQAGHHPARELPGMRLVPEPISGGDFFTRLSGACHGPVVTALPRP